MISGRHVMIGVLGASAVAGHLLYPAALAARSRGRRIEPPADPSTWPPVTVVVPAYLEAGVIAAKVSDILTNGYGGPLEVLVVADGDAETAAAAEGAGARVLYLVERGGKAQALNAGLAAAEHDIVVLSDANNQLDPGSIGRLVRWFQDSGTGAVAGEKVEGDDSGELLYWRFEAWLKRHEAALGTTIGVDGALCAVRRELWRDIPPDISTDDLWLALDVGEQGYRVAYEPAAVVRERSIGSAPLQWERRTRVLGAGLWVMWRKRHLLSARHPLLAFEVLGHRLWRSTLGPISHAVLLAWAVASSPRSRVAALFAGGHLLAVGGWFATARGRRVPRVLSAAGQVVFLQAVAFGGMRRFMRGDRVVRWSKPAR
jgi:cellulose synthase/poly-beta-1,6-N-acetylglucosamine synthase-like glycosyltransferase